MDQSGVLRPIYSRNLAWGQDVKSRLHKVIGLFTTALSRQAEGDEAGRAWPDLYPSSRRLLQAELEKAKRKDERVAAWEAYFGRMSDIEKITKARYERGAVSDQDYYELKFLRLEAELGLKRAKRL